MDKSVLFWTQKAFGYDYGAGFRNKDSLSLSNNEFRANEDFETEEKRKVLGIITIHEKEILITGKEMFIEYISQRLKRGFEVNSDAEMTVYLWEWEFIGGRDMLLKE